MAFPSIRISIGADVSKLKKDLQKGEGFVKSFSNAATRAFDGALLAAGAFVTKVAIDSVKAASDLNETVSKTNVIFGESAKQLQQWAESNATAMGQTRQQALDASATFALFGKQAGYTGDKLVAFSTKFTTLASDMASFSNTSPEDAITALGAALRGESEPIRRYGVLLSEAAIQQKAYSDNEIASNKNYWTRQGKKEVLNDQGKLLARYKIILEQTNDAQGDFQRTSDGLANGQRILNATWKDAEANIGQALLPALQDMVNWANGAEGKKFIGEFASGMADAFKAAAKALPNILDTLKRVGETASSMGIDFDSLMTPEVLAAGAAWRITPGGPQFKALAALAAYASVKTEAAIDENQDTWWGSLINEFEGNAPGPAIVNALKGSNPKAGIASRVNAFRAQQGLAPINNPAYNIIVNQATDPQQTAIAIQRAIDKANRMRVGTTNQNAAAF